MDPKNVGELLQILQDAIGEPDAELPHFGFEGHRSVPWLGTLCLTAAAMAKVLRWAAEHPPLARELAVRCDQLDRIGKDPTGDRR